MRNNTDVLRSIGVAVSSVSTAQSSPPTTKPRVSHVQRLISQKLVNSLMIEVRLHNLHPPRMVAVENQHLLRKRRATCSLRRALGSALPMARSSTSTPIMQNKKKVG